MKTGSLSRRRFKGAALKSGEGDKMEVSATIGRPAAELFSYWRCLENLPQFMKHLQSVEELSPEVSHWVMKTNNDRTLEWDAKIIEEKQDEMISWQSQPGASFENAGSVWFSPATGNRGTVVKVSMKYSVPGGALGKLVARVMGESPKRCLFDSLSRFKSIMEAGEAPTTEGQPRGNQ